MKNPIRKKMAVPCSRLIEVKTMLLVFVCLCDNLGGQLMRFMYVLASYSISLV